jgi:8-oxo-dGTP pyrophosphatase MutT (NUDIX family)
MTGTSAEVKIDRHHLIKELMGYKTPYAEERRFIGQFLALLNNPRCFYRDCFPGHITGSALLANVAGDKILMNRHKSLNMWLAFGGHADGDEDILSVAIRETMEESGITAFKPLTPHFIEIDIHPIPENPNKGEPDHWHYDVAYIMQMTEEQKPVVSDESSRLEWMTFDRALEAVRDNPEMIRFITKAQKLLND